MAEPVILIPTLRKLRQGINPRDPLGAFIARMGALDMVHWYDDFQGKTVQGDATAPGTYTTKVNASGTFAPVNSTVNGEAILSVVGSSDNDYAGVALANGAASPAIGGYQGQLNAVMAVRLKLSTISSIKFECGFTDSAADAGAINALSKCDSTTSRTATDCAVWVADTDDATDSTYVAGAAVLADSVGALVLPGVAMSASYRTYIVALRDAFAKFIMLNDKLEKIYESKWVTGLTKTVNLCPWVFVQNRTTTANTLTIDSLDVWQRRVV